MATLYYSYALMFVTLSIFVSSLALAYQQKSRPYVDYAIGFGCLGLSTVLIAMQADGYPFFTIYVANMLQMLFYVYLIIGLRQQYKLSRWTHRFSIHMVLNTSLQYIFLYVVPNAAARYAIMAVNVVFYLFELIAINKQTKAFTDKLVRLVIYGTATMYSVIYIFRFIFVVGVTYWSWNFMHRDTVNSIIMVISIFFLLLYFSAIQIVHNDMIIKSLAARNKELDLLARTDQLTGFMNRRSFNEMIKHYQEEAKGVDKHMSVLLFDLDHFKEVNDTYGHLTGDDVLRELAKRLHAIVPPDNPIVRWGGEEFMIITKLTLSDATKMAEKIRRSFEQTKWTADLVSMSASFGVAEVKDSEPSKAWLIRLDRALYEAKNSGRNRVVISEQ